MPHMYTIVYQLVSKMNQLLLLLITLLLPVRALRLITHHTVVQRAIGELKDVFHSIDMHTLSSMKKVLTLYKEEEVDSLAFHGVDGYGHGDIGREKFDSIVGKLLGAEKALVRIQFFSGTHAISTALFASLRPGDEFLSVSGNPYDTLEEVIGLRPNEQTNSITGSLKDWGIHYHQLPLIINKNFAVQFDLEEIEKVIKNNPKIKLIHIQR
jgi:cystathionine beta-lyase family protein involved in aluminum resistance